MERKRTSVNSVTILSCLTVFIFVEGRSLSPSIVKHGINHDNSNLQFHSRSLSAPYDIERCTWMQDSSCQINPRYVRAILSHSPAFSNEAVLEAVLDEASCLSTTHEAACISQKKCEWIERPSSSMGGTQSHCQYKGSRSLWRRCAINGLQDLVEEYMVCRRSQGGSCNPDLNCQTVQISATEEGCGLKASRVLDLIFQTPASQTEIISTLVESTGSLQTYDVPSLDEILALSSGRSSRDGEERRKLLDDDVVEDILAVDEGLDSASSTTKSVISGTGNAQGEEYDEHSDNEEESSTKTTSKRPATEREETSTESSTASDGSASSINSSSSEENSTNNTVLAGSLSFIVPTATNSDESKEHSQDDNSNASNDDLATQINQPLVLTGNISHLTEVDLSISVSLDHVADVLEVMASLVENRPWTEGSRSLFNDATRLLEIMRFRLDSQMGSETDDRVWSGADQIWWKLQHTVQSLDTLPLQDSRGLDMNIARLIESCEIARTTWVDLRSSEAFSAVLILETSLKDLLQDGSTPDRESESTYKQPDAIESLEGLISNVVKSFNRTLFSLYPQQLNISFTRKYKQVWVEVLTKRNKKWENIKTLVSNHSNFGQPIATMLKRLYLVQSTEDSFQRNTNSFLELQTLKALIDEVVGALIASRAGKYRIEQLPKSLASPGIQSWQRGPQITADGLNSAFRKATKEDTANARSGRNTGLPIESMDAVRYHLKALSVLIDAKITKSQNSSASGLDVRSLPETTAILRSVETALNILKKWMDFSQEQAGQEMNFYGNKSTTDFALSLAGCLVLAPKGDGGCRDLDKTPCTGMDVRYWSVASGVMTELESELICAPKGSEQKVAQLLHAPKQVSTKLAKPVADLFHITAYCPTLSKAECVKNEKCSIQTRLDEEVCRPSANIVNYHVEGSNIAGLAAREESCRSYLRFPVCTNLLTQSACNAGDSCLWIRPSHDKGPESSSNGMCLTNWAQQLFHLNSTTIDDNVQFHEDIRNCQEQLGEASCGIYGLEGEEATMMSQARLPKSSSKFRPWIVSCLTVLVTILFLMVVCISCKIHKSRQTPSKLIRSKKGRARKPKSEASSTRPPPFQMYSHAFELSPYGSPPSQKKTASFPDDVNALENAETGSQSSRLRVPIQQDPRLERFTSGTTAEISEIQPISVVDEIEPVSESESEDSWSSTDGWSDDSDEGSVPGSGSAPQGVPSSKV